MQRLRQSSSLPKKSSFAAADAVIAATAGEDSWKTWAGRLHGNSDFEWLDVWKVFCKRTVWCTASNNNSSNSPVGAICPVCFVEPEIWHITSSCSHAVCLDCLKAYAASQVQDPSHVGPLKCPVCPQVLRKKDAITALLDNNNYNNSTSLIQKWDEKIRNQLLRALPSYLPCPHCTARHSTPAPVRDGPSSTSSTFSSSGDTSTSTTTPGAMGGGFITPECLAPHHDKRRDEASRILRNDWIHRVVGWGGIYILLAIFVTKFPSSSPVVDLFFLLLPLFVAVLPTLRHDQIYFAKQAREVLMRPISVECPCCDQAFALPNTTITQSIADAESQQWIHRHTRACPACRAPISKQGGCNHMACPNCRAKFCWACMQLRTKCQAYQCTNGARFGNASMRNGYRSGTPEIANHNVQDPLLNRIDSILKHDRKTGWIIHGLVLGGMLVGRFSPWVQAGIEPIMTLVPAVFASGIFTWLLLNVAIWNMLGIYFEQIRRRYAGQGATTRDGRQSTAWTGLDFILGENNNSNQGNNPDRHEQGHSQRGLAFRTESEMIREALRLSLIEQ